MSTLVYLGKPRGTTTVTLIHLMEKNTKKIWKTIKPLFSDKALSDEHITLVETDDITDECSKVSEIFSAFFGNAVKNLGIERINWELECDDDKYNSDPVIKAIKIHDNHLSILKIKTVNHNDKFTYIHTTCENVYQEISSLNNFTGQHSCKYYETES